MRRTTTPDMRPEAIDRRLREVAQLHRLGVSILKAKRLGRVIDVKRDNEQDQGEREAVRR